MHKSAIFFLLLAVAFSAVPARGEAHTREEVRQLYGRMVEFTDESPYLEKPVALPPYLPGGLTEGAISDALNQ